MPEDVNFQQVGAIVRIQIRNFMTYSETEIRPGPNLNMILGPNGTGKSAVVCCIIVGLAGEVTLTGRGASPADFVKKDTDWATTHIELYNNRGPNYTVERKITITNRSKFKTEHKSEWQINSKPCLKAEVIALTKKLNIKVDNLCQFLPQDSVTQFVKMNTCELLLNTLKAAGDNQLVDDHQNLVAMTAEVSDKRFELRNLEQSCKENETNVQRLESDVQKLRQREELIKEKTICSEKIYYAKYQEAKCRCDEAKAGYNALKEELTSIKNQSEPFRLSVEFYKGEEIKMRQAFIKSVEKVKTALNLTETVKSSIEERKVDCQKEYSKFREKQSEENKRENAIKLKQQELDAFEAKLHDLRDVDCSRQIAQVQEALDEVTSERKLLQKKKAELEEISRNQVTRINDIQREHESIRAVDQKKIFLLRQRNNNAYRVLEWLGMNKDKFKQRIYQPIMSEINVKDHKYNNIIEAAIPKQELSAFVCQSTEDLLTFTRLIRDQLKISFNVILAPDKSMDAQFKRDTEILPDLREFGVKAYLKDLIDAPEPIMRYLCGTYNFHRIPVADTCSESQLKELLTKCPKFYVGNQLYTVSRSRYDKQSMTVQESVRDAQSLIYSFDKQRSDQCLSMLDDLKKANAATNIERTELTTGEDELRRKWQSLAEKQTALHNQQNERTRLQAVMNINKEQLTRLQNDKIDLVMERGKLQKSIEKINLNIAEHLKNLSEIYKSLDKSTQLTMTNLLLVKIAVANNKLAVKRLTGAQSDTTRLQEAIKKKQEEVGTFKSLLNTALAIAEEKIKGFKPDGTLSRSTQTKFNSISQNSVDDLTCKLDDLVIRIQGIYQDSNNTLLNEFNRLNEQLKDKRFKLTELKTSIEEIDLKLEAIKKDWLPKLQEVIKSININYGEFMKKLSYGGEVRLDFNQEQPNNFAAYGIMILVKYRDKESLIPLSSTRQSGGERSVATMIYMLALQAKTSVPFRCVDEINQGMDKENERKVFELLVSTADSSSSQYFLVSPKLLNNLPYSEKMKIHVVFNGKKLGLSWNDI